MPGWNGFAKPFLYERILSEEWEEEISDLFCRRRAPTDETGRKMETRKILILTFWPPTF
jgi:hypothetical protein